jgi:hypothetical protein
MLKRTATFAMTTCLALGSLLASSDAHGARTAASVGWGENSDIKRDLGSLWNSSGSVFRYVYVPVTVAAFANYTLSARFRGNGSINSACRGMRVDGNNNFVFSAEALESSTSYTTHSLGTLNMVSGTSLVFRCGLAHSTGIPAIGGAVNAFDWN